MDKTKLKTYQSEGEKNAIREIEKVLLNVLHKKHGDTSPYDLAEALCDEGYRKQSVGEWVKTQFVARTGFYTIKEFPCNQCGEKFEVAKGNELMHFCPNCGAKMKGGAE